MSKNRKPFRWWLILIVALFTAALLWGVKYAYVTFFNPMSAFDDAPSSTPQPAAAETPVFSGENAVPTPTPEPTLSPEEQLYADMDRDFMKNRVNILMLGWDESPERNDESSDVYRDDSNNFRSDVIMLLSVDFEEKKVDLISVPRDTYAKIYNVDGRFKINAAFAKGGSAKGDGFAYAMNTVSELLGVPVNHYAGVNMEGLKAVVDAMGGVDYDVDVEIKLNGRVLSVGPQHLDGQQVLDYCRARKGISTDVGRNDRQQRMLFSIFSQLKSRDQIANLPRIYMGVKDYISTDLNFQQISALCAFALDIDMDDLSRHTLEGEYISSTPYSGASYYVLYNDKLVSLVHDVFGISISPDPRYDVSYVSADKAGADALGYVSGAAYIKELVIATGLIYDPANDTALVALEAQMQAVRGLVNKDFTKKTADQPTEPLDTESIQSARSSLSSFMSALCTQYGFYQSNTDKKQLPSDFYKSLPKTPPVTEDTADVTG